MQYFRKPESNPAMLAHDSEDCARKSTEIHELQAYLRGVEHSWNKCGSLTSPPIVEEGISIICCGCCLPGCLPIRAMEPGFQRFLWKPGSLESSSLVSDFSGNCRLLSDCLPACEAPSASSNTAQSLVGCLPQREGDENHKATTSKASRSEHAS